MRAIVRFMTFAVCFIACLFIAVCALLYVQQDGIVFHGVKTDPEFARRWQDRRIVISGEVPIEGWWVQKPESQSKSVVLYFGGNAEDVLQGAVEIVEHAKVGRVLATNYRSYGGTPGKPSEQVLYRDALAVYDYAIKQPGVTADNLIVIGRSLGSGVAAYIAANRPVRGVVLITPYDSIAGVAQAMYPILPIRWLVKHPFRSDALAPQINAPVLILAGEQDVVIPAVHAQRLYEVWAGPKQIHVLKGVGHNDIGNSAEYYPLLNDFLRALAPQDAL